MILKQRMRITMKWDSKVSGTHSEGFNRIAHQNRFMRSL